MNLKVGSTRPFGFLSHGVLLAAGDGAIAGDAAVVGDVVADAGLGGGGGNGSRSLTAEPATSFHCPFCWWKVSTKRY